MLDGDLYGAQDVIKRRSNDIGNKLKLIFWFAISELGLECLLLFSSVVASMGLILSGGAGGAAAGGTLVLVVVIGLAIVGISIAYAITLFGLAKYNDAFQTAAVMYLIRVILSLLQLFISGGFIGLIINIAEYALKIGFIVYFCNGMIESVRFVDGVLASQWASFKNVYLILCYISIGGALLTIIPVIGILGGIAALLAELGLFGVEIWELVLIWQAAGKLQNY